MKNTKFILFFFMSFFMVMAMGCKKDDIENSNFRFGDDYEGGIIFYWDATREHGLVAAPSDQGTLVEWGCYGTDLSLDNVAWNEGNVVVGPGAEIGDGASNTAAILNDCPTAPAALACVNYKGGGYTDWFLPSATELDLMYTNLHLNALGDFGGASYWSSTEASTYSAWKQAFYNGSQLWHGKGKHAYVRAVRAF